MEMRGMLIFLPPHPNPLIYGKRFKKRAKKAAIEKENDLYDEIERENEYAGNRFKRITWHKISV